MDKETLKKFDDFYEGFKNATENIDDEYRGILRSEAFFVRSLCGLNPKIIIESGRARGQSTFLLAKSLPDTKIISIEYHKDSADSDFALERLSECQNVQCLFGDSRKLIPELVENGDILLIDGPKDLDALILVHKVLKCARINSVFIHDAYKGSNIRRWLSFFKRKSFYSDLPKFIQKYCHLDSNFKKEKINFWQKKSNYPNEKVYGGTFVYLDSSSIPFSLIELISIYFYRTFSKLVRSLRKRLGLKYLETHPCD